MNIHKEELDALEKLQYLHFKQPQTLEKMQEFHEKILLLEKRLRHYQTMEIRDLLYRSDRMDELPCSKLSETESIH